MRFSCSNAGDATSRRALHRMVTPSATYSHVPFQLKRLNPMATMLPILVRAEMTTSLLTNGHRFDRS